MMSTDEERAGRELGAQLKLIEAPAVRVDVDSVLRAGRRSERRWRIGHAVGVAVLAASVGVPAVVVATRTNGPPPPERRDPGIEISLGPVTAGGAGSATAASRTPGSRPPKSPPRICRARGKSSATPRSRRTRKPRAVWPRPTSTAMR